MTENQHMSLWPNPHIEIERLVLERDAALEKAMSAEEDVAELSAECERLHRENVCAIEAVGQMAATFWAIQRLVEIPPSDALSRIRMELVRRRAADMSWFNQEDTEEFDDQ